MRRQSNKTNVKALMAFCFACGIASTSIYFDIYHLAACGANARFSKLSFLNASTLLHSSHFTGCSKFHIPSLILNRCIETYLVMRNYCEISCDLWVSEFCEKLEPRKTFWMFFITCFLIRLIENCSKMNIIKIQCSYYIVCSTYLLTSIID